MISDVELKHLLWRVCNNLDVIRIYILTSKLLKIICLIILDDKINVKFIKSKIVDKKSVFSFACHIV